MNEEHRPILYLVIIAADIQELAAAAGRLLSGREPTSPARGIDAVTTA